MVCRTMQAFAFDRSLPRLGHRAVVASGRQAVADAVSVWRMSSSPGRRRVAVRFTVNMFYYWRTERRVSPRNENVYVKIAGTAFVLKYESGTGSALPRTSRLKPDPCGRSGSGGRRTRPEERMYHLHRRALRSHLFPCKRTDKAEQADFRLSDVEFRILKN